MTTFTNSNSVSPSRRQANRFAPLATPTRPPPPPLAGTTAAPSLVASAARASAATDAGNFPPLGNENMMRRTPPPLPGLVPYAAAHLQTPPRPSRIEAIQAALTAAREESLAPEEGGARPASNVDGREVEDRTEQEQPTLPRDGLLPAMQRCGPTSGSGAGQARAAGPASPSSTVLYWGGEDAAMVDAEAFMAAGTASGADLSQPPSVLVAPVPQTPQTNLAGATMAQPLRPSVPPALPPPASTAPPAPPRRMNARAVAPRPVSGRTQPRAGAVQNEAALTELAKKRERKGKKRARVDSTTSSIDQEDGGNEGLAQSARATNEHLPFVIWTAEDGGQGREHGGGTAPRAWATPAARRGASRHPPSGRQSSRPPLGARVGMQQQMQQQQDPSADSFFAPMQVDEQPNADWLEQQRGRAPPPDLEDMYGDVPPSMAREDVSSGDVEAQQSRPATMQVGGRDVFVMTTGAAWDRLPPAGWTPTEEEPYPGAGPSGWEDAGVPSTPHLRPIHGQGTPAFVMLPPRVHQQTQDAAGPPQSMRTRQPLPTPAHPPPQTPQYQQSQPFSPQHQPLQQQQHQQQPQQRQQQQQVASTTYTAIAAAQAPALQNTVPAMSFTSAPAEGFSRPNFNDPEALLAGLSQNRIASFSAEPPNTVVLVRIYNISAPPPGLTSDLSDRLSAAIHAITGEADPFVVPPEPDWTIPASRRETPRTWIVLRLTPHSVRTLVEQIVWSASRITFFAFARESTIPRYLFTIGGYTRDRDRDIFNAVWNVVNSQAARAQILELVQANPTFANVRPEDAANAVIGSLVVRVDTLRNGGLIAAIYMDSPTMSVLRWREWRNDLASYPFPTTYNLTGFLRTLAPCAGCHAHDHVTHLCPYPLDVPGWNAPPAGGAYSYAAQNAPNRATMPARGRGSAFGPGSRAGPSRGRGGRGQRGGMAWMNGDDAGRPGSNPPA
ncbi:hypothetical protein OH77DRAFT_1584976 [Trametes cingulata]|nr:hypothetical protein OH77DRAFT_1584976 [Trametes cingulata]